jgi:2-C-methyl-D-erythritol 4-phosphate cytidylyltransferase
MSDSDGEAMQSLPLFCPQVIQSALLAAGFRLVAEQSLEVTDDVSIIEALGKPVKITKGAYSNIKVSIV